MPVHVPPRRTRTFEPRAPLLGLADALDLSLDAAEARIAGVSWPDTELERVRFFDGSLRVADTDELLANNNEAGFAVAIRGDLVVDGQLDAVGDYDSVLVVGGNVWAEVAIFRRGVKSSFGGTLEVASVIMCSEGDDGGTLWAAAVRAQVLSYSQYFPKPDADTLDTFVICDEKGDVAFGPARASEVFVREVLSAAGMIDENKLAAALRAGRSVLL